MASKKQKKISKKNQETQVNFNKKIYSKSAIQSAILAYKDLSDFKTEDTRNYIKVTINNLRSGDLRVVKNEFCNYVLHSVR